MQYAELFISTKKNTAKISGCIEKLKPAGRFLHIHNIRLLPHPQSNVAYCRHQPKSILKNGLIPKIGERSQLVGETEKYVYLCGRKDVPFWSLILDKPVVLRVEMKDGEVNENNVYQYSYYSETLAETAIPAERIRKSRVSRSLTDEQMKDLAHRQYM